MSGIAGEINQDINYILNNREIYENMRSALKRRGPDRDGIYIENNAALIYTCLAAGTVDINNIDKDKADSIENGKQPMIFKRGEEEYILVCDGKLYNSAEIKKELELLGHEFTGYSECSDAEIIGRAYIEWKDEAVRKFNGVFAFAILEIKTGRVFAARDRMGVKPFFYVETDGGFIFASEIKALLCHPAVRPDIDANSIGEIMLIGPGRTPGYGVFKKIKELEPAMCAVYNRHRLYTWKYWCLQDKEYTDSFEQTVEKVRELVIDSIERQLILDGHDYKNCKICTLLSGGLDSSLLSSVAGRYFRERGLKLHSFSVDYKDNDKYFSASKFQPNSDKEYIERMKKYLSSDCDDSDIFEHHQIILDTDRVVNALYAAVDARDLPGMADIDSSLLCFCEEIKKHVSVALSGECSDEIFGGYPWFRDKEIRDRYGFPWSQSLQFRKSFLKPEYLNVIDAENYVGKRYSSTIEESDISEFNKSNKDERRIKEMANLNMKWFMQTLIDRTDRMSMYNGLEVRVPYCDVYDIMGTNQAE